MNIGGFTDQTHTSTATIGYSHPVPNTHPCPTCGHCPTCGRGGFYSHWQIPSITTTTYPTTY